MHHKTSETICENPFCTFEYLHNGGGHIVKTQHRGYTANMLKDALHPFQQASLVLRKEGLRVAFIGIGKGNGQRIAVLLLPGSVIVNMLSEVHLATAQCVFKRQIAAVFGIHDEPLFADILFHAGIAAAKVLLIPQTAEYPPYGVALLARDFAVILQPFVNHWNEIFQHRKLFGSVSGRLSSLQSSW